MRLQNSVISWVGKVQLDTSRYSGPDITSVQQSTGAMQVLAGDKVTGNYLLRQDGRCFVMDASYRWHKRICPQVKSFARISNKEQAAFDAAMSKWLRD